MFDTSRAACNRGRGAQYAPAPTRLQVHGDGADLLDCRVKKYVLIYNKFRQGTGVQC